MENKKIKILAIDDNRDNLITLKAIISEVLPQSVVYVELSGQGGIGNARKNDPDVILLDIVMPGMDGYEVCKTLKADEQLSETPVIFLTALKGDKQSRILALEAGGDAFLAKPIDSTELKAQILAMLKIKEAAAYKRNEKLRLAALVQKQTEELKGANIAALNLLEDLKTENEIRKQSEEALRISKELLSETEIIGKVGGWSFNIDTMEQKWTDEVYRIHEVEISTGPSIDAGINYYTKESRPIIEKAVQRAIEHGENYDLELEIITAKGNLRAIHTIGKADLKNRRIHGFFQDITQRKQAEEKLKLLNRAVEASSVSVVITDAEGDINYVNPYFTELTGYSLEEVLGKNPRFLKSGNQPKTFYEELWNTILSGKNWTGEFQNRKKNNEFYWENAVISPILNKDGKVANFVAIKEDITERKKMLEELLVEKGKAEESNRLKTAFLQNMSHEIRTPMNGILGFMKLLKDPTLSGENREEFIEIVEKSGQRLLTTINDIIEISKIESGKIEVTRNYENIEDILQNHYNFFNTEIEKKGLSLKINCQHDDENNQVLTDRFKLDSIFINLINNAIKFTKQGNIEIGCYRDGDYLVFYVRDTGIGIPANKQEAVFERFVQADMSITRGYEGSGLGLSISKAYSNILGGKIWLDSVENTGTTFYFSIPYKTKNHDLAAISIPADEKLARLDSSMKILIAENDETSFLLLETILSEYGIVPLHAGNGEEAIITLKNNPDIALILMDLKMPVLDGIEATRKIRQFDKSIPIIAQTAYAFSSDKENAIEAGCNDYISKPLKESELISLIQRYNKNL